MSGLPDISMLGWFHTGIAILALASGFYSLAKFRIIQMANPTGKIYLIATLVTALTALSIFRHGAFGPGHGLAVLTLLALMTGTIAEKTRLFGKFSPYIQAASFSGTILFHMIPAITDGLMRLPVGAPIVTDIRDPLLLGFYLTFLIIYLVGLGAQIRWLRNTDQAGTQ